MIYKAHLLPRPPKCYNKLVYLSKEVLILGGTLSLILIIAVLVIGIIFCFAGFKYLRKIVVVYMFISGFLFVYNLLTESFPGIGNAWLIALIVGLVLALLSAFFIKFCIFITGGTAGVLIYMTFMLSSPYIIGTAGAGSFLYGLIFFAVFGILALIVKKHLIIILTAYIGAETITQAAGMLIGVIMNPRILSVLTPATAVPILRSASVFSRTSQAAYIIPVVIFVIAGMLTQYKFTAKRAKL